MRCSMIDVTSMQAAAEDVVSAALTGQAWDEPLGRLAVAAGARDAGLMRNTASHMVAAVVTGQASDTVAAFAAGKAPPNSRYERVKNSLGSGFRVDHDDYSRD